MARVTLDGSTTVQTGTVRIEVRADELEADIEPTTLVRGAAEASARAISNAIRRAPGHPAASTLKKRREAGISISSKWSVTGKLAASIRAERQGKGFAIVAAADRLEADVLVERLAADVRELADPVTDAVDAAIEQALDDALTVRRR